MRQIGLLVAVLALCIGCSSWAAETPAYVFSSFRGNGESGLHLAYSRDGRHWRAVNEGRPLLKPAVGQGLMRDPSIIQGPDGRFHMVWTTGWWDQGFGIAHSDNLVDWSEQAFIPAMAHEPTARNTWAPEIFWDTKREQYVIYWASTIPGRFPATADSGDHGLNHRIYYVTTKDFQRYSPTRLFYDPGFNVIDSVITRDGDDYVMILKDETRHPPAKHLRAARSHSLYGPWSEPGEPFTPDGVWVEGPTIAKVGQAYWVYYDQYRNGRYGAMASTDFVQWADKTAELQMPEGTRHGTALKVPAAVLESLALDESNP